MAPLMPGGAILLKKEKPMRAESTVNPVIERIRVARGIDREAAEDLLLQLLCTTFATLPDEQDVQEFVAEMSRDEPCN
jgi:hypothetical protein